MHTLLSNAGRAFLRVFVAALIVYAYGVLAAPTLHDALMVGFAALLGAVAAGIRALQTYVPQLTVARYIGAPYGDILDSFLQGLLGALVVSIPNALGAPDLHTARMLFVAAIIGALTAGLRAVQGFLTKGQRPAPAAGLAEPPPQKIASA